MLSTFAQQVNENNNTIFHWHLSFTCFTYTRTHPVLYKNNQTPNSLYTYLKPALMDSLPIIHWHLVWCLIGVIQYYGWVYKYSEAQLPVVHLNELLVPSAL